MINHIRILLMLVCCVFLSCKNDDPVVVRTYPDMAPGLKVGQMLTTDPGDSTVISAQLADIHGLKKVTITCPTLSLKDSIDLTGKISYMLNYKYIVPANIAPASFHTIKIIATGKTDTISRNLTLLAVSASDYSAMYVAYENETEASWGACLNAQALPRTALRTAPYTYNIRLYSPAAKTRIALLGQKSLSSDRYGIDLKDSTKIKKGQQYVQFPGEGYYDVAITLLTKKCTFTKVTPTIPVYKLYMPGSFSTAAWGFKDGINDLLPVYASNPYMVRRTFTFTAITGGFAFSNTTWSYQIKPLAGYTSWANMGEWAVVNGSNTKDIWLATPAGTFEVTVDYFLMKVTIIKIS